MYRVLIVDDDKAMRYMMKRFKKWEEYGFCIAGEACDGRAALKRLAEDAFDLAITDIRMPGMNGLEFLHELRAKKMDICLILLSTYTDFEYAQQGIRLGVFDYMTKPVEDEMLSKTLARVKQHLDEKKRISLRLAEEKLLAEQSLSLYYPEKGEQNLRQLLFAGRDELLPAAEMVVGEVIQMAEGDFSKAGLVLERVLENIKKNIQQQFPWLDKVDDLCFPNDFGSRQTGIKEQFVGSIKKLLTIIRKYELHHRDGVVKKTCTYVLAHVEEEINLENVAAEVHMTKSYVGKIFKQKTGYNFTDYVTKIKMEHAKTLLRTGDYKNYEVSEKLGYSSTDYFCRLFKQYSGLTPLEFRKQGE